MTDICGMEIDNGDVKGLRWFASTNQFHGNCEITKVPYSKARLAMWRFCLFELVNL